MMHVAGSRGGGGGGTGTPAPSPGGRGGGHGGGGGTAAGGTSSTGVNPGLSACPGKGGSSTGGGGIVKTGSGLDDVEDTEVKVDTVVDKDHVSASEKFVSALKSMPVPTSAVGVRRSQPATTSVWIPRS